MPPFASRYLERPVGSMPERHSADAGAIESVAPVSTRNEPANAAFPTFEDMTQVRNWGRSYYDEIFSYLERLSDEEISQPMRLPWAELVTKQLGRAPAPITISETMLQVPLHSLYHRGQINARLREVGGEPPTVDYIVWIWLEKPAANWDSTEQ